MNSLQNPKIRPDNRALDQETYKAPSNRYCQAASEKLLSFFASLKWSLMCSLCRCVPVIGLRTGADLDQCLETRCGCAPQRSAPSKTSKSNILELTKRTFILGFLPDGRVTLSGGVGSVL